MNICLSHRTALAWLMRNPNPRTGAHHARAISVDAFDVPAPAQVDVLQAWLEESLGTRPGEIDVLVSSADRRRNVPAVRCRVCSYELPSGSFIRLACDIPGIQLFISSPELVFLQLCGQRGDFASRVYTGMALCSDYLLDPTRPSGVRTREGIECRLTSKAKIKAFLSKVPGAYGSTVATDALRYVLDASRSPMESKLAILFSLPARHGGFNLDLESLNPPVEIPGGNATRYPDLRFRHRDGRGRTREAFFDYDGDSEHATGSRKHGRDARRRNELATLADVACFALTTDGVSDFNAVAHTAECIRRAIGQRSMPRSRHPAGSPEREREQNEVHSRRFDLWKRLIGIPFARMRDCARARAASGEDRRMETVPVSGVAPAASL